MPSRNSERKGLSSSIKINLKAKKHLGQHFLSDTFVIDKIIDLIKQKCPQNEPIIEVGPGQGVLTFELLEHFTQFKAIEFDRDMIKILIQKMDPKHIINEDFLSVDLSELFENETFNLVGNFPYNISSQIIFTMIKNVHRIPIMVGMFQKEVAERICSTPGGKTNGILSLRAQAYYETEKVFDIPPEAFDPPPRVQSSIIVLKRKENYELPCDEKIYARAIKTSFQQRRKKMRNTLKGMVDDLEKPIYQKRPEQLSVEEFINIAIQIENQKK